MKISSTKQQHSNLSLTTIIEITSITRIWERGKANPQERIHSLDTASWRWKGSVIFHRHQYTDGKSSKISYFKVPEVRCRILAASVNLSTRIDTVPQQ